MGDRYTLQMPDPSHALYLFLSDMYLSLWILLIGRLYEIYHGWDYEQCYIYILAWERKCTQPTMDQRGTGFIKELCFYEWWSTSYKLG
jgi:hypothetical protein